MVLPPERIWSARDVVRGDTAEIEEWFATGSRDPNERDVVGWTLLNAAAFWGKRDVMRVLLERNATDVEARYEGHTPLHFVALDGRCAMASLLLDRGANVNARESDEWGTPLTSPSPVFETSFLCSTRGDRYAAKRGHVELVKLLLRRGADLDARDRFGDTAENDARRVGAVEAAALLADIRAAGGWRPYVRAPRARLLALRHFCERGEATPPADGILGRLFPGPRAGDDAAVAVDGKRRTRAATRNARLARTALPKEVFWLVLKFWRCGRDAAAF